MAVQTLTGPQVLPDEVRFRFGSPARSVVRVRLLHELRRPRAVDFERARGGWTLRFPRPDADRLEYQLELTHADGALERVCDPDNPLRASGPFGEKSVVEFPEYEAPAWLDEDVPPGELEVVVVESRTLRSELEIPIWTAAGGGEGEPLPLLFVHDGPEFAEYASLVQFLDAAWADGRIPTMRAALLPPPGDRNQSYSASAQYAKALVWEIVPALTDLAPVPDERPLRVGMGASLGALAMLHAHRLHPQAFGGLYLQSGSFFRQRFDPQEAGFVRFRRITRFVGDVLAGKGWWEPIPVTVACGTVEENLQNNRAVAAALRAHGYDVELDEFRDAHNWTGWRDTFDPDLPALLERVWA